MLSGVCLGSGLLLLKVSRGFWAQASRSCHGLDVSSLILSGVSLGESLLMLLSLSEPRGPNIPELSRFRCLYAHFIRRALGAGLLKFKVSQAFWAPSIPELSRFRNLYAHFVRGVLGVSLKTFRVSWGFWAQASRSCHGLDAATRMLSSAFLAKAYLSSKSLEASGPKHPGAVTV